MNVFLKNGLTPNLDFFSINISIGQHQWRGFRQNYSPQK